MNSRIRAIATLTVALTAALGVPSISTAAPVAPPSVNLLGSNAVLRAGRSITAAQYRLTFGADGNAVLFGNGRALWSTGTAGKAVGGQLTMRSDGVLTVYNASGGRVWNSTVATSAGARLTVQTDGNLVIRRNDGSALWSRGRAGADSLAVGAVLRPGEFINASTGTARLVMQADGRLAQLGSRGGTVWSVKCAAGSSLRVLTGMVVRVVTPTGATCWQTGAMSGSSGLVTMRSDNLLVRKTSAGSSTITPGTSTANYLMGPLASAVLAQVNRDRAAHGVPALSFDARLWAAANKHNVAMSTAGQLSHQLPGEVGFSSRITAAGYAWRAAAENVGLNYDTSTAGALQLQAMMMAEVAPADGHKRNLLNPNLKHIGVAVYVSGGKLWLTQDFGTPA